jgi:hypothetical protein
VTDYDTYDRRVQLGASRHRWKDAEFLLQSARWNGAVYLAGYAIECSLKSLICYGERKDNLKDTSLVIKQGVKGADLHNLWCLYNAAPASFRRAIDLDRTRRYHDAWAIIVKIWRKDERRYGHKLGEEVECQRFFEAVKVLYTFILRQQGEAS